MTVLGLDIGGANIKAATSDGQSSSHRFALWQRPDELAGFLANVVLPGFDSVDAVALTMTGELCDCFDDKRQGVEFIVEATRSAIGNLEWGIYSVLGDFMDASNAKTNYLQIAASNWHALANFSRRFLHEQEQGLLVDIGSTSCDILALTKNEVANSGNTDTTRIQNHELVYTGSYRTPVCAVANQVQFRDSSISLAQELFATMADVYVVLGDLPPCDKDRDTADGRPLTLENSRRRLARSVCADRDEISISEIEQLARQIALAQRTLVQDSIIHVANGRKVDSLIHSGSGHFVVARVAMNLEVGRHIDLNASLGPKLCTAAPAYAVAKLMEESS